MLRSRSQWAQADAAGCLGWLVGHIQGKALHELLALVTQLMVKHTSTDDEVFLREERQREDQKSWGRNRGGKAGGGGGRREGGGNTTGGHGENGRGLDQDQARERMDNIRVYTLIFLLKVIQYVELNRALLEGYLANRQRVRSRYVPKPRWRWLNLVRSVGAANSASTPRSMYASLFWLGWTCAGCIA